MSYKINVNLDEVFFTGDISEESCHELLLELSKLKKDHREVGLHLMSSGGSVYSALRVYDYLTNIADYFKVTCIASGYCYSSAILILLACHTRLCTPHTSFLVHPINSTYSGTIQELSNYVAKTNYLDKIVDDIYCNKTKITTSMRYKESYLTAEEALDLQLVEKIL